MDAPKLEIIRKATFRAAPWKNGGGITHEALRVPRSGDPFRWRVSFAHIDASGPFSEFAAYQRKMVLLQGAGIKLTFANDDERELRHVGDLVEFDGAVETHCDLLAGPCVDLNLMVLKSESVAVRVESVQNRFSLRASATTSLLVVCLETAADLIADDGGSERLEPWDLGVLHDCAATLEPVGSGARTASAVFLATLNR